MEEYKRICEVCGKELFYKSYPAFWLAEKNNKKCDLSVLSLKCLIKGLEIKTFLKH